MIYLATLQTKFVTDGWFYPPVSGERSSATRIGNLQQETWLVMQLGASLVVYTA